MSSLGNTTDEESRRPLTTGTGKDSHWRTSFCLAVYGTIGAELTFTIAAALVAIFVDGFAAFLIRNYWLLFWIAFGVSWATAWAFCCPLIFEEKPYNYILMVFLVFANTLLVCLCCAVTDGRVIALIFTILISVALVLSFAGSIAFADITKYRISVVVLLVLLLIAGIIVRFVPLTGLRIAFLCFGVLVFGFVFVYNTQLVTADGFEKKYDDKEQLVAVAALYTTLVVSFFLIVDLVRLWAWR